MRRRGFIGKLTAGSAGALFLPGWLQAARAAGWTDPAARDQKKLVVIKLAGGNDGLNMVVPYGDPLYYRARPTLAIPKEQVIQTTDTLGFNPVMKGIAQLYREKKVAVINNVGYPDPNRSHFRSMDIWETASGAREYLRTGWLGRWLDTLPPASRKPYMAIDDDEQLSLALKGKTITGIAVRDPKKLHSTLQRGFFRPLAEMWQGQQSGNPSLDYLHQVMEETVTSADYIWDKTKDTQTTVPLKPGGNPLAASLQTIATMMEADMATPVYYTTLTGFDTHVREKSRQDRLLKEYSEAVTTFAQRLEKKGLLQNTLILTFSEFGRRVAENASGGTDHGCASNVLIVGGGLKKPGIYNEAPDLARLDQGDLRYTIDFRSVYATLLEKWLDADAREILGGKFPVLEFI